MAGVTTILQRDRFSSHAEHRSSAGGNTPSSKHFSWTPRPVISPEGKWADGKERTPLPMDPLLTKITDKLSDSQVVIVTAETGTGKSTRIPQALLLAFPDQQIYITQPHRSSVGAVISRVAEELGERPGNRAGWRLAREEPVISKSTRIIGLVNQSLTNMLLRTKGPLPEGIFILDEAHLRDLQTDVSLGIIKERLKESPGTRIIIQSATIDGSLFADYLGVSDDNIFDVRTRNFQVDTVEVPLFYREHHSDGAIRATVDYIVDPFSRDNFYIPNENDDGPSAVAVSSGSVIVLLPGEEDIRKAKKAVAEFIERRAIGNSFELAECFGRTPIPEVTRLLKGAPKNKLRIIFATESLRSSKTIPDAVAVVDSSQIKRIVATETGSGHLQKVTISRADADQAKGRVGRTRPGLYFPVTFGGEYKRLEPFTLPEVQRLPLSMLILQIASLGRSVREFPFINPPDSTQLEAGMRRCQLIGAIDDEEKITDFGRILANLPLSPETGASLIKAKELNVLPEAIIATAIFEEHSIFRLPRIDRETRVALSIPEMSIRIALSFFYKDEFGNYIRRDESQPLAISELPDSLPPGVYKADKGGFTVSSTRLPPFSSGPLDVARLVRKWYADRGGNDLTSIIEAYRDYAALKENLEDSSRSTEERKQAHQRLLQWCDERFINVRAIEELHEKVTTIYEELAHTPLRLEQHPMEYSEYNKQSLTFALLQGYFDRIGIPQFNEEVSLAEGSVQRGLGSIASGDGFFLVGRTTKIHLAGRALRSANKFRTDEMVPLSFSDITKGIPNLISGETSSNFNPTMRYTNGALDTTYRVTLSIADRHCTVDSSEIPAELAFRWITASALTSHTHLMATLLDTNAKSALTANSHIHERLQLLAEVEHRGAKVLLKKIEATYFKQMDGMSRLSDLTAECLKLDRELMMRIEAITSQVSEDLKAELTNRYLQRKISDYETRPTIVIEEGNRSQLEKIETREVRHPFTNEVITLYGAYRKSYIYFDRCSFCWFNTLKDAQVAADECTQKLSPPADPSFGNYPFANLNEKKNTPSDTPPIAPTEEPPPLVEEPPPQITPSNTLPKPKLDRTSLRTLFGGRARVK